MATDLGDLAIVRAIVDLGHSLGLRVVAEGVEEEAARDPLLEMGCDVAQGFLISRPLRADRFEAWLAGTDRPRPGARARRPSSPWSGSLLTSCRVHRRPCTWVRVDCAGLVDCWLVVRRAGLATVVGAAPLAQSAERLHGKEKVYGSIP